MRRACRPLPAWLRWALPVCAAVLLIPRPATSQCTGPAFGPFTGPAVGGPFGVVVGDFWGATGVPDGVMDIVVTRELSNEVALFRGDTPGSFLLPPLLFAVGSSPTEVVAADFDGNGRLDIAILTGSPGASVQVLPGTGSGFSTPFDLDPGLTPTRLAIGDFNRDGRPDLVLVTESAQAVQVWAGNGAFGFNLQTPAPVMPGAPSDIPTMAVPGDFNRDGAPDLAVTIDTPTALDQVAIYLGDGTGHLGDTPSTEDPYSIVTIGSNPRDIVAGDVDRDGTLDLVTADAASSAISVLTGVGDGTFTPELPAPALGSSPNRVVLADYDRDGLLDAAALDTGVAPPEVVVLPGQVASPYLDSGRATMVPLAALSIPRGLTVADVDADGRPDLVATENAGNRVVVATNTASPDCAYSSFADAPRAYASGNAPVGTAVADLDADGVDDLVVAATNLERLRGTGNGYVPLPSTPTASALRGVATADFNVDGHPDVVGVLGNEVQLFLNTGTGDLTPSAPVAAGTTMTAVVAGDFNEDGIPDVAATAQTDGTVHVFLGNVALGLVPAGPPIAVGTAPLALAVGDIDNDTDLDLAVANAGSNSVTLLFGDALGGFPTSSNLLGAGEPWGVALGHLGPPNNTLDVVTADHASSEISVWLGTGSGAFAGRTPFSVTGQPIAVAALEANGDTFVDVTVVTGDHILNLLPGDGTGTFPTRSIHPVRTRPSAITAVDADADGQPDLAIPCRDADSVVVLLSRPPSFSEASRVGVGDSPRSVASADFDRDGDLDLAVVNFEEFSSSDTVSILENDPLGTFSVHTTLPLPNGSGPEAIVAADFNRDGFVDLAVANIESGTVSVFPGLPGFGFGAPESYAAGLSPSALATGDFNRDGKVDLAVTNRLLAGTVTVLGIDATTPGPPPPYFAFSTIGTFTVGDRPTSVFFADLNRDGALDLVVANLDPALPVEDFKHLTVLLGDGVGDVLTTTDLSLTTGDRAPVSVAGGDFDGDGDIDLAAVHSFDGLSIFDNDNGTFASPPSRRLAAAYQPTFVTTADLNRDGRVDLAIGAAGLKVMRGQGGLAFAPSEDLVAGLTPRSLAVGDFDRDGRLDVAVVNEASNDVSILLSSACKARRLVLTTSPTGCGAVGPLSASTVTVQDDGGNPAVCTTGQVVASLAAGPGSLTGDVDVDLDPLTAEATFSALSITPAGDHYQLAFDHLPATPPPPPPSPPLSTVLSRSFTLGAAITFTGPASICPASSGTYTADPGFESYSWMFDTLPPQLRYASTVVFDATGGSGYHDLTVDAWIDTCNPTDTQSIYVGALASVTITPGGPVTVCVDCLGGPVAAAETGGGTSFTRQWGYRTVSGTGSITDIDGQTSDTYVINGLDFPDFPAVSTYYLVATSTPSPPGPCGSAVISNEIVVTITESVPNGEVMGLGATSRGPSGNGENLLQWANTNGSTEQVLIRWNRAAPGTSICAPPADPFVTLVPPNGEMPIDYPIPPAPAKDSWLHPGLALDTAYCYSVFVKVSGAYSPGRTIKARPFASDTGPVKWAFATGATAVVPPTVSGPGILAVSNDRTVLALERGTGLGSGEWPSTWSPTVLNGVAHSRSPVVPLATPVGITNSTQVFFTGDDSGDVLAVDAETGGRPWGPLPMNFPNTQITGAPGGFFTQWGGPADAVLVGTRNLLAGESVFYSLKLDDGSVLGSFNGVGHGGLGAVTSTPSLDYSTGRAYFTSWMYLGAGPSVWCVQIDALGAIASTPVWSQPIGDVSTSPVLANGRVYVSDTLGTVYSLDATNGSPGSPFPTGDGPVKGFLFPDRRGPVLYFATDTTVWSVTDLGGTLSTNWTWNNGGALEPNVVLHWPGTDYLYVGDKTGTLWQVDFSEAPTLITTPLVLGDGTGHIGAPSFDRGHNMLLVGSESGVLYAVEVPLP